MVSVYSLQFPIGFCWQQVEFELPCLLTVLLVVPVLRSRGGPVMLSIATGIHDPVSSGQTNGAQVGRVMIKLIQGSMIKSYQKSTVCFNRVCIKSYWILIGWWSPMDAYIRWILTHKGCLFYYYILYFSVKHLIPSCLFAAPRSFSSVSSLILPSFWPWRCSSLCTSKCWHLIVPL